MAGPHNNGNLFDPDFVSDQSGGEPSFGPALVQIVDGLSVAFESVEHAVTHTLRDPALDDFVDDAHAQSFASEVGVVTTT